MAKKIATIEQFNSSLKTYVTQRNNALKNVLMLSHFAIRHFEACGDLGPAQRLFDSMTKGYENRAGFARWMCTFSPALLTAGKFSKDKSEAAAKFDLSGALALPFWESFPMPDAVNLYGASDVKDALEKILSRFENEKRQKASDAKAKDAVTRLSNFITTL